MEEKRDRRRRDLARMKAKARRIYGKHNYFTNNWAKSEGRPEDIIDPASYDPLANHIKCCSCWMCGNPRRFFKGDERITMQERRFLSEETE